MPNIIHRKYGLSRFRDIILTRDLVIEIFGEPDEEINHHDYSIEMKYNEQQIRFYYLKNEPEEEDGIIPIEDEDVVEEVESIEEKHIESIEEIEEQEGNEGEVPQSLEKRIFLIGFKKGKTDEGININYTTMKDVFNLLGEENWLTTKNNKYWWTGYSGISFYVEKEKNEGSKFPIQKYINKKIKRITIPIMPREEGVHFNEDGQEIYSMDDFCGSDNQYHNPMFDETRGENICSKCGLVLNERMISEGLMPRSFNSDDGVSKQQHGTPITPLLPDIQMATMIDKKDPMSPRLRKAVRWDSRYTWKQRNMIQATSEIKRIGTLLNLPLRVKEYAISLYKKAYQLGLLKGRSIRAMVCASIYYASTAEKVPRTLNELVEVSGVNFHDITKSYQVLIRHLNLKSPSMNPRLLVSKFIAKLGLTHDIEVISSKIVTKYSKIYSLSGKDPKGIVAAAIYFASNYKKVRISQTKISKSIGITEVTIRNRLKEIQKFIRSS